ncbi:hypothetical protein Tco_0171353, partial [Tanacetum coccineum]
MAQLNYCDKHNQVRFLRKPNESAGFAEIVDFLREETEPPTDEHIYEEHSPVHHHFSPSQAQASSYMPTDDLLQTVPKLISRIDSLELDL